jgi:alpha-1,6-mannosyltransferase
MLVAVDDAKAMANAVVEVWRNQPRQMGQAARSHVEGRFEWERTFEALLGEVYPRALSVAQARMEKGRSLRNGPGFLSNLEVIRQASR